MQKNFNLFLIIGLIFIVVGFITKSYPWFIIAAIFIAANFIKIKNKKS